MAKYEVTVDEAFVGSLSAAAAASKLTVPQFIGAMVTDWLKEHREKGISEEFKRLVEESITENELVLRRFAR